MYIINVRIWLKNINIKNIIFGVCDYLWNEFLNVSNIYYWKVNNVLVMFISCDIVKSFGS